MQTRKIAVLSQSIAQDEKLFREACAFLQGYEVVRGNWSDLPQVGDAHAIIVGSEGKIDAANLHIFKNLRVIAKYGVGLDNVLIPAEYADRVKLCHWKGINSLEVAELALGLIISMIRGILANDSNMRRGDWKKSGGSSLSEHTVGIWGVGAIGQKLALLAKSLGADVLGCDIEDRSAFLSEIAARQVDFDELLEKSTILSLNGPLDSKTFHLIGDAELAKMPRGSYIVNTARGALVEELSLVNSLKNGHLSGAALDVYEREPLAPDSELLQLPQVILSPHSAGNSISAKLKMTRAACKLIRDAI